MIDQKKIEQILDESLQETDLFPVSVSVSGANVIEIILDSDTEVSIDRCTQINRTLTEALDQDQEDFELTVMSAGIGQPLKLLRQFRKLQDQEVEVRFKDGTKLLAILKNTTEEEVTLAYTERVAEEGKKRKVTVERERTLSRDLIQSVCEHLTFK
ncbi:MAG: ribosome assembly cofactor RimP [Alistipes sp.]|nr:ribosome assembly cofactor RimP [Alistipes sp.]